MGAAVMTYWAAVITFSGLFYLLWASLWPLLFQTELTRSVPREGAGYPVGSTIHWRLPVRATVPLLFLDAVPFSATLLFDGWVQLLMVTLSGLMIAFIWLAASPGLVLRHVEIGHARGKPLFETRPARKPLRDLLVFVILGLLPALLAAHLLRNILI
jgi:hypothetical protein